MRRAFPARVRRQRFGPGSGVIEVNRSAVSAKWSTVYNVFIDVGSRAHARTRVIEVARRSVS
eukprot:10318358-Lingulodinium_polyedra.AAC.1